MISGLSNESIKNSFESSERLFESNKRTTGLIQCHFESIKAHLNVITHFYLTGATFVLHLKLGLTLRLEFSSKMFYFAYRPFSNF